MGYQLITPGAEALATDINNFLMNQVVARFPSATARTAQLTAPVLNQLSQLDTNPGAVDYWNGTAWATVGAGAELSYTQITAPVTVNQTAPVGGNTIVTSPARTYDGSPVVAEFFSPNVLSPPSGTIYFFLFEGPTVLSQLGAHGVNGSQMALPVNVRQRFTPTAGSHSYAVGAWVSSGTGTVEARTGTGGTYVPAYLRITRA